MAKFQTVEIDRVKHITREEFIDNYFKPQKPVLIEGLTQQWGAHKNWTLDYIQAHAGDLMVPLYNNKPAQGSQSVYAPVQEMELGKYIQLIKTEPTDLRIFFLNILDKMPELLADFEYPDLGLKFFKRLPALFFGGSEAKVFMHYDIDLPDNMHFHFHGDKRVVLFSPDQSKYLYKVPFSIHNIDKIDMDDPDFEKYPALEKVQGITATMKHGDALYMPSGYWHYIKYLNGGFSMTLRALPRRPKQVVKMLYNVFFMRHFDNLMRRVRGQKWLDYKEQLALKRTNRFLSQIS